MKFLVKGSVERPGLNTTLSRCGSTPGRTDDRLSRGSATPSRARRERFPVTSLARWLDAASIVPGALLPPTTKGNRVRDRALHPEPANTLLQRERRARVWSSPSPGAGGRGPSAELRPDMSLTEPPAMAVPAGDETSRTPLNAGWRRQ